MHDTGHRAYPAHYNHHSDKYYDEWDELEDKEERRRRMRDLKNTVPLVMREVDSEFSKGFSLEQPTTYSDEILHDHLQPLRRCCGTL